MRPSKRIRFIAESVLAALAATTSRSFSDSPSALHRNPAALVRAGEAEHVAYVRVALGVLEVRLGDPLGAQRVTRQQYPFGDLSLLGTDVRTHGRDPASIGYPSRRWRVRAA